MFFMYLIRSKLDGQYYIGQTSDLKRRIVEHNRGDSKFTRKYKPWKLVYFEAFISRDLAFRREKQLKRKAKTWQELLRRLGVER